MQDDCGPETAKERGKGKRPAEVPEDGYRPPDDNDAREAKRAEAYGLKLADLLDSSIVVGAGEHARLSGLKRKDERGLVRLQPRDLDDVKRWIGVPDDVGGRRSCCQLPAAVPGVSNAADVRKLDPVDQRALRDLAHEYVHGDSRRVARYKSVLDHLVDRAVVSGVFVRRDIDIHTGAVLEVDKDLKVLFARHIRIWRGGLLKLRGATKIDCVTLTGNLSRLVTTVHDLPSFATLVNLEAVNG